MSLIFGTLLTSACDTPNWRQLAAPGATCAICVSTRKLSTDCGTVQTRNLISFYNELIKHQFKMNLLFCLSAACSPGHIS
jgi:hypothetical protein